MSMVIARKKDGTTCIIICIDFRKLNQYTQFDPYPMPRIDDLFDAIGTADFITTLDLAMWYWKVPMAEKDKMKTAFTRPIGLYHFTVMLFELSGAPATFQRMMDAVLRRTEEYNGLYLNDVIIFNQDWESHLQHIKQVFQ